MPRQNVVPTAAATEDGDGRPGRGKTAARLALREAVDQRRHSGRDEEEAPSVEALAALGVLTRQEPSRERDGQGADRDVDVEDPAPAGVLHQDPADDGAE